MNVALTFSILALALTCGCRSTSQKPEIAFERVLTSQLPISSSEAKNAVVKSFAEWQAFAYADQGAWTFARDIDWSKKMLIAVSLGSRPSGGYAVEIDRVYKQGSHWIVHARETRPAPGSFQTAMITSPFDCVATPRFEGKVEFIVE